MGNILELNRLNIQIPDAGVVRIVAGAIVTIYDTMPDGTAAVTKEGVVSIGAVKSILYTDRNGLITKSNPLIADSQGLVDFYTTSLEIHVLVSTPSGTVYGIPWFPVTTFVQDSNAINVRSFGAKGDGVTDDAAAIMAAHNALPSTGGKLIFDPGQYLHKSQLAFTKSLELSGSGGHDEVEGTIPACSIVKHGSVAVTGVVLTGLGAIVENITFRGLAGNTGDGVQLNAARISMVNVSVREMGQDGIRLGNFDNTNANACRLVNVSSRKNGRHGFMLHSDDTDVNPNCNSNSLIGCIGHSNTGDGFHIANSFGNVFLGGLSQSNTGWGYYLEKRAQGNVFIPGDIEVNTAGGIKVNDALSVDNVFITPANTQYPVVYHASSRTQIFGGKEKTIFAPVIGEALTNNPGPSANTSDENYIVLYGGAVARIKFGWNNDPIDTGLIAAQVMVDISGGANTLNLASRDTVGGKVKLLAGTGLANTLLLDPQNVKLELSSAINFLTAAAFMQFTEMTEPSNGPANSGRLFTKDNGAGKTQLCVRFNTGVTQVIATEP